MAFESAKLGRTGAKCGETGGEVGVSFGRSSQQRNGRSSCQRADNARKKGLSLRFRAVSRLGKKGQNSAAARQFSAPTGPRPSRALCSQTAASSKKTSVYIEQFPPQVCFNINHTSVCYCGSSSQNLSSGSAKAYLKAAGGGAVLRPAVGLPRPRPRGSPGGHGAMGPRLCAGAVSLFRRHPGPVLSRSGSPLRTGAGAGHGSPVRLSRTGRRAPGGRSHGGQSGRSRRPEPGQGLHDRRSGHPGAAAQRGAEPRLFGLLFGRRHAGQSRSGRGAAAQPNRGGIAGGTFAEEGLWRPAGAHMRRFSRRPASNAAPAGRGAGGCLRCAGGW